MATSWDEEQVQRRADGGCLGALLPMKDAATRRNALGRGWHPVIQRSPNGATRRSSWTVTLRCREGTGGTETSQYLEEKRGFPE